jgi:hypothetical protein
MSLFHITLRLARNPGTEFLYGDAARGYSLTAPLTETGYLDLAAYQAAPKACKVHRFAPGTPGEDGHLRHRGKTWYFDYLSDETSDDEPLYRLGEHSFRIGDYVTVSDETGRHLTYQVSEVHPTCSNDRN